MAEESPRERDGARFTAQLLSGPPAADPLEVVDRLLAVQAQDPRGARLAVRARTAGLRAADVDRALTAERSLVVTTLNRGTLHLVRSQDYWWLHALTTPRLFAGSTRRLGQEGVSTSAAELGVTVIRRSLQAEGPLTRWQLRERLRAARVPVEGQALVHVLLRSALLGHTLRGPMVGAEQAYVLVSDWLGPPPAPVERCAALAMLARRYLAGHAPAADGDLARWAGLPLRDARHGLRAIAPEVVERADGLVDLAGSQANPDLPPPRLLGAFDPLLHGWVDRSPVLGGHRGVVTMNGVFRPFVLVDGLAVATWRLVGSQVVLDPFDDLAELDPDVTAALDADAADVLRFLGK